MDLHFHIVLSYICGPGWAYQLMSETPTNFLIGYQAKISVKAKIKTNHKSTDEVEKII